MYSDEDLALAVKKGIFSADSVEAFRAEMDADKQSSSVDEEHFKLIGGFNDIFIVIACGLLLFSSFSVLESLSSTFAYVVFAAIAWGLAEFFVLRRKMALPAIVLLVAFVGGVAGMSDSLLSVTSETGAILAAVLASVAAYIHWQRFNVPVTIAVGVMAVIGLFLAILDAAFPNLESVISAVLFLCGVLVFLFAMTWDSADRARLNYRSDVAFWLHLLAAPLIIHPIFTELEIIQGEESLFSMLVVIVLYVFVTLLSIVIDRRVFMVSALVYVIYALSGLLDRYGMIGSSFALTGVVIGALLLSLSAYWHRVRAVLVGLLPDSLQERLPELK